MAPAADCRVIAMESELFTVPVKVPPSFNLTVAVCSGAPTVAGALVAAVFGLWLHPVSRTKDRPSDATMRMKFLSLKLSRSTPRMARRLLYWRCP